MQEDIRDIPFIEHRDVVALNFIRCSGAFTFRRHFRQGLRSHIVEILDKNDVNRERHGVVVDGLLQFPRARPKKILRIFRRRFNSVDEVLCEIKRVKMTEQYLSPDFIAQSSEIIVDYHGPGGRSPLLCGVQDYVTGIMLDPWKQISGTALLNVFYDTLTGTERAASVSRDQWVLSVKEYASAFVAKIKKMIHEKQHMPDLAGVGNILITPSGHLKLVDINNISRIHLDDEIRLDDRGYPVCDKSMESLALIEQKILGRAIDSGDHVYRLFLDPGRKKHVAELEKSFASQIDEKS